MSFQFQIDVIREHLNRVSDGDNEIVNLYNAMSLLVDLLEEERANKSVQADALISVEQNIDKVKGKFTGVRVG